MGDYSSIQAITLEDFDEFYDYLIESGADFDSAVQRKLVPLLREAAEDEVKRRGAEQCEFCGCWSDLIEDSPDGSWLCPDCMGDWEDEQEEW